MYNLDFFAVNDTATAAVLALMIIILVLYGYFWAVDEESNETNNNC